MDVLCGNCGQPIDDWWIVGDELLCENCANVGECRNCGETEPLNEMNCCDACTKRAGGFP